MTVAPAPTTIVVTGSGESLASAFTKINSNEAAQYAWEQAVDANNVALQSQISAFLSLIYKTPPGNYTAPAAGGAQVYSANGGAAPWTTATPTGRTLINSSTAILVAASCFADLWDAASASFFAVTGPATTSNPQIISRLSVTGGVPSVSATVALGTQTTSGTSTTVMGAVATTPTTLRLTQGNSVYTDFLATYGGGTLTLSSVTGAALFATPSNNRRSALLGTTSWLMFGVGNGQAQINLRDRAANNFTSMCSASETNNVASSHDALGGGFFVRGASSFVVPDPAYRPALILEYVAETGGVQRLATLRIGNPATFGGWVSVTALSSTLVIAQYKDTSAAYYTVAVSVATSVNGSGVASGSLGLYGPFSAGLLGAGALSYPVLYNATTAYFLRQTSTTGACKLSRAAFVAANTGTELTCVATNDVSLSLGVAQAGNAAIAGITALTIINVFMLGPDQMVVVYYVTATTNGYYAEVFTLS